MNKIMYEVNYHHKNDKFSHCTVSKITVIREGILPDCSGVTITAIDQNGRKFYGNPNNYFNSENDAWISIDVDIKESINNLKIQIDEEKNALEEMENYIKTVQNKIIP